MEKKKTFAVRVTQSNLFSRKFLIEAPSAIKAKHIVIGMLMETPIDKRHGTYDATKLGFEVAEERYFNGTFKSAPFITPELTISSSEKFSFEEKRLNRAFAQVTMRLRNQLGMSRSEFGKKVKLAMFTLNEIENGKSGVRLATTFKIAQTLGKNPDDFIRLVLNEYLSITRMSSD